jgi:hypothetical protein
MIQKLTLPNALKSRLYELAASPKNGPDRITGERLNKIKKLIQRERFSLLSTEAKWEVIAEKGVRYQTVLEEQWD